MEEREMELDLREYIHIIRKRVVMILAITIMAVIASAVVSGYVLDPVYKASTTVMIAKPANSIGGQIELQDLNLNQRLARTYGEIVQSRTVSEEVIRTLRLSMSPGELTSKTSVDLIRDTEFITINVTDKDPANAALIANTTADVFRRHVTRLMQVDNVQVLDRAEVPNNPISPRVKLNIAIAGVLGLMASIFLVFLLEFLDNTIKTPTDVERHLGLNVIGTIPMMNDKK
ncbi:Wzz/FepE/Etk N-terminal domain-containing protein [Serpentinicella sp. ANB-PHB4]|uniref:YveK family protein n=1 Tax=Serpentinicella sp. ANB-PHB4 TaxID=3074076 RepID=UPI0028542D16|nr:Wzz/FepE/Etk N-terminal domain-containing protein [Serpentinicella sp. ANB-PHB4]MDR5659936.1 Wzz/FepE/Etk N-terminal domain-containing protein [Serpentinicella sp. ANB-PHB4]